LKKKSLLTLALAAIAAPSWSQSVTLFGVADAFAGESRGLLAAPATAANPFGAALEPARTRILGSNGLNATRIGFRGTEDLGGGHTATFVLENQSNLDTGTTPARFFHRQIWVALSGPYGRVALGRQYSPWNDVASNSAPGYGDLFDPYVRTWRVGGPSPLGSPATGTGLAGAIGTNNDVGNPAVWAHVRMDKSIRYDTPKFDGLSASVHVAMLDPTNTPTATSAMVLYDKGPVRLGIGYYGQDTIAGARRGKFDSTVFAANYDFGPAKLWSMINVSRYDLFTLNQRTRSREGSLGVTAPVGPMLLKASFAVSDTKAVAGKDTGWAVEAHYNLSKRTALYAAYSGNKWGELLNGQAKQKGFVSALGIRHFF
jgi:predicted porin